jgi:hypothetical protein
VLWVGQCDQLYDLIYARVAAKLQKRHTRYHSYLECLKKKVSINSDLGSCAPLAEFLEKIDPIMIASEKNMLVPTLTAADNDDAVKRFLILRLTVISTKCHELFHEHKRIVDLLRGRYGVFLSSQ